MTAKDQHWDLSQLITDEDERDKKPRLLKWAKIILPHVGLIVLSCVYVAAGAAVFYVLEQPNETLVRASQLRSINATRLRVFNHLWASAKSAKALMSSSSLTSTSTSVSQSVSSWRDLNNLTVSNLTDALFGAFDSQYIQLAHVQSNGTIVGDTWTWWNAVFFTSTLLTTIGYGNVVPMTFEGRMFCLSYGLFGVPLILITVADIGKFLSEHIVWLYCHYVDARHALQQRCFARSSGLGDGADMDDGQFMQDDDEEMQMRDELERFGLEDYISIPVSLVLFILLAYVAVGAVLLGSWEHWDFFTGFYFSFITMTTVGFGDIVPRRQEYYMLDLLYIVIGLAITTMCIDLVGIQYIRKIHYFGRAIKDARYALVNINGRMVHVSDLMKYASVLQKKYGLKNTHGGLLGNELFPGSYKPRDLRRIRYIDSTFDCSDQLLHHTASVSRRAAGGTVSSSSLLRQAYLTHEDTILEEHEHDLLNDQHNTE